MAASIRAATSISGSRSTRSGITARMAASINGRTARAQLWLDTHKPVVGATLAGLIGAYVLGRRLS